jgi:1-acyl-sn-glycerol-3-phosphate acyltransferase
MFTFLPAVIKGPIAASLFALNTIFWCALLYPFITLKIIIPSVPFKNRCRSVMIRIAESWIACNDLEMRLMHKIRWHIRGLENLHDDRSYLVCANHQSWVDIVVLQHVFNKRIPLLRFFLKQELIYVPVLGAAWWGLDFPFMKRYSRSYLEKYPEKKGQDIESIRRAGMKFRGSPTSVLTFAEGTRFTPEKRQAQRSPYRNLLVPKAGGIASVLDAMGSQFDGFLDVTIHYPEGPKSLWGLFSGQLNEIVVRIEKIKIPNDLLQGNYLEDERFREGIQAWVRRIWEKKDQLLSDLKESGSHRADDGKSRENRIS